VSHLYSKTTCAVTPTTRRAIVSGVTVWVTHLFTEAKGVNAHKVGEREGKQPAHVHNVEHPTKSMCRGPLVSNRAVPRGRAALGRVPKEAARLSGANHNVSNRNRQE
jgi:hypothetical protein